MKVFRMNECDCVCAETVDQAKEFYQKAVGYDDIEVDNDYLGEVDLQSTMSDLDDDGTIIKVTFAEVIAKENITSPCIIASTEA